MYSPSTLTHSTSTKGICIISRDKLKHDVFLGIARDLAVLSTCSRKQVGAVVVRDGRCITWGYNGAPPGAPHCDAPYRYHHLEISPLFPTERDEQWAWDEAKVIVEREGCRNATHAEANALAFAAREGISTDGGTLYVTVSPCEVCARLLIAAGIAMVFYEEEYRDRRGIEILTGSGVACFHWSRDGWPTRPAGEVRGVHQ